MCPIGERKSPRAERTRDMTTVLATEIDIPRTTPAVHVHPASRNSAASAMVVAALCNNAPTTAIRHAAKSS